MKNQKGITLIALVITIIVMLILVGVSVTVALNGGLFTTAQNATDRTKSERDNELALSDGKVEINGEWYNSIDEYVNGNSDEEKVEILPKKETYTIGEEVTIDNEAFYVIADTTEKVTLLAKYNLNTEGTAQINESTNDPACVFSSTNYWSSETEYPLNLNTYEIPEGETSVITTAKAYGEAKGGIGRLLTEEEATLLEQEYDLTLIYGPNVGTEIAIAFWTATAYDSNQVWTGDGNTIRVDWYAYDTEEGFGVRPVVEISKSKI